VTRAFRILAVGQDFACGLGTVGQTSGGNGDVKEAALHLQGILGQTLPSIARGSANTLAGWVENTVVARAEEAVVLGFPPHLTAQVGTGAGESDEISVSSLTALPGDVDRFSGGALVEERLADLQGVGLGNVLPG
jgi:hypothetical protein